MREDSVPGLKALRNSKDKKPRFHCDNCRCNRYNPCTCKRAKEKK